jgi:hypothetical protein
MAFEPTYALSCGPNGGGIKRGDRADTGDDRAARRDGVGEHGSGAPGGSGGSTGHVTGETDSLAESGGGTSIDSADLLDTDSDLEDLTVRDASDPSLGLTGTADHPAEDWAADTGPSKTAESESQDVQQPPLEIPDTKKKVRREQRK